MNVPFKDVPRWPLVPNATNWLASSRSGVRSKYSFSNLARSTSISLGAGFPASGEILHPLNSVAGCFFSNALDILALSNIVIPIGRSCGHMAAQTRLENEDNPLSMN